MSDTPELEVASMPANSYFIVMTHNHQMDFEISQAILKRADFHYLGLIASDTKWRRFKQRYKHRDIDENQVARMNCPIGLSQVGGKLPMEVAVSVSAEIINIYQAEQAKVERLNQQLELSNPQTPANAINKSRPKTQQGIHWQALKQLLETE